MCGCLGAKRSCQILAISCLLSGLCQGQDSGFSPLSGLISSAAAPPPKAQDMSGFIKINQNSFSDQKCKEFILLGWNAWTDVNYAAKQAAYNIPLPVVSLSAQNDDVANYFKQANGYGFNTVRVFAHGNSSSFQLQTGPGAYDENVFRGFDYILAQASENKIKVVLVIINNWLDETVGSGKLKYCSWANLQSEDEFWTDSTAMQLVKSHLSSLANRRNTFTGIPWKEDPTILYWELFYEPRCPASQQGAGCPGSVTSWYDTMAQYMHTQDENHLISTGEEGFFAVNSSLVNADPYGIPAQSASQGRYWSANLGQDFEEQHRRASISHATFQMWEDSWNTSDSTFASTWIGNHTAAARTMGKPLVLAEFGKVSYESTQQDRIAVLNSVFAALERSLIAKDNFKGMMFWRWPISNTTTDSTSTLPGQPAFTSIVSQVNDLQSYMGNTLSSCGSSTDNILAFTQQSSGCQC